MAKYIPLDPQPQETGLGALARNVYDIGAKTIQAGAGLPGDIVGAASGLINTALRGLGASEKVLPQAPHIGSQAVQEYITDPLKQTLFSTTHEKPTHPIAETIGDIGAFTTRALLPPFGASSLASVPGVLGRAIIGEAGAQAAKGLGGGGLAQTAGRIGTTFLGSLFGGRKQATQAMKNAYSESEKAITNQVLPNNLAEKALKQADEFGHKIGERALENKSFLKEANNAIKKIALQKNVPVKKIWDLKNDINEHIGSLKSKSQSFRAASELSSNLDTILREYGKSNVDFGKNYTNAQEIFKGLQAATDASRFLRENISLRSIAKKPLVKALYFSLSPTKFAAGAATGVALKEATKLYDLYSRSPEARKYAGEILKGALQQNSKAVIKNVLNLENEYKKNAPKKYIPID